MNLKFGQCLYDIEAVYHPSIGCIYTWSNKKEQRSYLVRKLDRVIGSMKWFASFGQATVDFLFPGVYDHFPALISMSDNKNFGPNTF